MCVCASVVCDLGSPGESPFPVWRSRFLLGLGGWWCCRLAVSLQFHHKALPLFCPSLPLSCPVCQHASPPHLHPLLLSLALQVQLIHGPDRGSAGPNTMADLRPYLCINSLFYPCIWRLIFGLWHDKLTTLDWKTPCGYTQVWYTAQW